MHPAASTDPALTGITVSSGTLTPAFAPATTSYTVSVSNATTQVTIAATKKRSMSEFTFTPATDADGNTPGHQVALSLGANTVTIVNTAHDGATTRTYTLVITRDPGTNYTITAPAVDHELDEDSDVLTARTLTVTVTGSRAPTAAGKVLCTIAPDTSVDPATSAARVGANAADFTAVTAEASFTTADTTATLRLYRGHGRRQ